MDLRATWGEIIKNMQSAERANAHTQEIIEFTYLTEKLVEEEGSVNSNWGRCYREHGYELGLSKDG